MTNWICKIFGHKFETPYVNYLKTNICNRCGYENEYFAKEGYYAVSKESRGDKK